MNRLFFAIVFLVLSFSQNIVHAQDALLSGFKTPPPAAKARTWWHWIDGNITKTGITTDLEAMKRVGIQEAQIFNVGQGYPQGPAAYLSPQWLELFKFAITEAKRLGLEIAFHNGPGWSSSGGPWVKPEQAMQTVVYSDTKIKGGDSFNGKLKQPPTKFNYYKDIAVLAFPTPKGNEKIDGLSDKSLSVLFVPNHLYPSDKVIDQAAIIDKSKIIDITAQLTADGNLNWNAPAGDWTILRIGHTPTGMENHPGLAGGQGLEIDKMSRPAVDAYWAAGIQPILDKVGPLVGNTLNNCLIDSYEVGCNNWTTGFADEFKKRRQYEILQYLPTLAGYYVESGEVSERFLWDFRKTIGDLMADNYFGYFAQLCHKAGMKFSVEPYGGPFESLKVGPIGDIVMGEFWLSNNAYNESTKLAASIAHLKGSPIVGAEAFTSFGGWKNHPATMKSLGDFMWTEGITRFIFHTYTHQPWEIGPGLTFHQYGMDMNRHTTWWEQSKAYMDYVARSQYLLQQGKSTADVLVFSDESTPNDAITRPDIKALGYDYDQIGPDQLAELTAKSGKIYSRNGLVYRLLVLPQLTWATPQLLNKLKELVAGGATIIGPKPFKSPSLQGYPGSDRDVARLANELWPNKISADLSVANAFEKMKLAPDFSGGPTGSDLHFIHRRVGNDDIYFVSNSQAEQRVEKCSFRTAGGKPEVWNAETGRTEDVAVWKKGVNGTIEIPLTFNTDGSVFVIFRGGKLVAANHLANATILLDRPQQKPLPELKIIKAEYGTFLPDGLLDVTDIVKTRIGRDGLRVSSNNGLFSDPAPGVVKELRIAYQLGGQTQELVVGESKQANINFNNQDFKLIRVLYGKFPRDQNGVMPKYPIYNVAGKIDSLVHQNKLIFGVNDAVFKVASLKGIARELRIEYATTGTIRNVYVKEGNLLHLEQDGPQAKVVYEGGKKAWVTPYTGKLNYSTAAGSLKTAKVTTIAKPIELTGAWEVSFPQKSGTVSKSFDQLISWSQSADDAVRYFSGTAVYKKQFNLTADYLQRGTSLELDLGNVGIIAEVIVNGKNLGILWKIPFRIDLRNALHAGKNDLEIRVTNQWINRLIGDEKLPNDVKWNGVIIGGWPEWVDGKTTRNSKRTTFTTYRHYDEKSPLQPAGLLGPVIIRSYKHVALLK
ncbi:MAG: glycosyl hydrolase [Bacteroidota bacterium]